MHGDIILVSHFPNSSCHGLYFKWIDAEDLEKEKLDADPVLYHEAWKKLCGSR